ncbi:Breast cancer 1, early onset [Desmophyllum pertusum]|uniref:Breast cancer 1, early onset n=1 Tax=Desmophyllum pertusum TaxID=174260 RepID=A0A9X0CPB4_9CNID|nr:Breast cancer 1, early onset [Desmophyllum pertusum]
MSTKVKDVLDALQQMQKSLECSICLELLKDPHSTNCNHQFCGQCIRQVLEKSSKKSKNKWYCPLCKTPVSKRSLTPNPKLNEIVAAVRNLQGAVQEDTGIPTGSPPLRPFKSSSMAGASGSVHFSTHHPTPRKFLNDSKDIKQKASNKNQFSVYIENNENLDQALESKQPQVISNVNIRSTLGPSLTQTTTSSEKSKKSSNTKTTRRTRNSRRIAQENQPGERINGRNVSEELLHMIDTLPFQPVSREGPTCPTQDEAPMADEPEPEPSKTTAPSHNSGRSTETASSIIINDRITGSKETDQSTSVQCERTACLTTIAEADSSMRTSPCDSTAVCGNTESLPPCVNTTTNDKENEGAVSSTKFDSCPLSSSDTMQSVSILPSLDCHEQCNAVPGHVHGENQQDGARRNEDAICQDTKGSELISTESCDAKNQEEPFIVFKERQASDYQQTPQLSQSINTQLPTGCISGSVTDRASLDFEGLVSLFDDPSLSKPEEALQKNSESEKEHPNSSKSVTEETSSPVKEERVHADAPETDATDSDLCERVKKRQRIRPSNISVLQLNRRSEPVKKSGQLKTKTRKRSVDYVAVLTRDEPIPDGNARKKFRRTEVSSLGEASPQMVNTESKSQEDSGLSNECKDIKEDVNGSTGACILVCGKDDEQVDDDALGVDSHLCSSGKTVLSYEMIPASVSSSEKSVSPVIDPMIAHVHQALEGVQGSATKDTEEWGSQNMMENGHAEVTKNHTPVDDCSRKIATCEESPQIKPVWHKENRKIDENLDKENSLQDHEPGTKFTTSEVSSPEKPFMTASRVVASKQNISPKGKEKNNHMEDGNKDGSSQVSVTSRQESQPFDPSEDLLLSVCDPSSQFHEEVEEPAPGRVDSNVTHKLRNDCNPSLELGLNESHLAGAFNSRSQEEILLGETGTTGSKIKGKLSKESAEAEGKTPQSLSQETGFSDNTPSQSSLEVMDAMTPCLFGNDSWDTPDKNMTQKTSRNQRCHNNVPEVSATSSKYSPRSSRALGPVMKL